MRETGDDRIVILSNGINGSTFYQAENSGGTKIIIPWLGLEDFSGKFIGTYPDFSKKIRNYCEDIYPAKLPEEIVFPKEQTHAGRLIEKISLKFLKK